MDWLIYQMAGIVGYIVLVICILMLIYVVKFSPSTFKMSHPKGYLTTVVLVILLSLFSLVGIIVSKSDLNDHIEQSDPIIKESKSIIAQGEIYEDYNEMREAYFNLKEIDKNSYHYDLSEYIEDVNPLILFLNIEWIDDRGETQFEVWEDNGKIWIDSGLENQTVNYKDYNYFNSSDYSVIGYRNKYDSSDRFKAYRIEHITEDEIEIYVYATNEVVTLKKK